MPLDTQPLSPPRRALRAVVMLGMLLVSLALAQAFVVAHRHAQTNVVERIIPDHPTVVFRPPRGFTQELPQYDGLGKDLALALGGRVAGQPRIFLAFSYLAENGTEASTPADEARAIYDALRESDVEYPVVLGAGKLAGQNSIVLQGGIGPTTGPSFIWINAAAIRGKLVAICYSGPLPITDADNAAFVAISDSAVVIRNTAPHP